MNTSLLCLNKGQQLVRRSVLTPASNSGFFSVGQIQEATLCHHVIMSHICMHYTQTHKEDGSMRRCAGSMAT